VADFQIEALTPERVPETAAMLARAFVDSPVHVKVFGGSGPEQLRRNKDLFQMLLERMPHDTLVMLRSGRVVGSVRWAHSDNCRLSRLQRWTLLPAVLLGLGSAGWRMNAWLRIWNDHDNAMPHLHLGPLGVDPSVQGTGLGSVLMQAFCEALAERRLPGYLETEKLSNVYFYQRFGFSVTDEVPVMDVPTWLMLKPYRL
jgi:GNAT superfamily N-acetyltransferase